MRSVTQYAGRQVFTDSLPGGGIRCYLKFAYLPNHS